MKYVLLFSLLAILAYVVWYNYQQPELVLPAPSVSEKVELAPAPVVYYDFPEPEKDSTESVVASKTAGIEPEQADKEWRQKQYRIFAQRLQKHFNNCPLTDSADFWLIREAIANNNSDRAQIHLQAFFSRAQPEHLRFAAAYIALLTGVARWLINEDELRMTERIFSAIAGKNADRLKTLREKFVFVPGTGLLPAGSDMPEDTRERLLQKVQNYLGLALRSQGDLIKMLYIYNQMLENRCVAIRTFEKTSEEDAEEVTQYVYPDVSHYERMRFIVQASGEIADETKLQDWFTDFIEHWNKPNIPFCLHGGRLDRVGDVWLCRYHFNAQTTSELESDSLEFAELLIQYMICHPEIEVETISGWLEQS
jgi:hypothetical protein